MNKIKINEFLLRPEYEYSNEYPIHHSVNSLVSTIALNIIHLLVKII